MRSAKTFLFHLHCAFSTRSLVALLFASMVPAVQQLVTSLSAYSLSIILLSALQVIRHLSTLTGTRPVRWQIARFTGSRMAHRGTGMRTGFTPLFATNLATRMRDSSVFPDPAMLVVKDAFSTETFVEIELEVAVHKVACWTSQVGDGTVGSGGTLLSLRVFLLLCSRPVVNAGHMEDGVAMTTFPNPAFLPDEGLTNGAVIFTALQLDRHLLCAVRHILQFIIIRIPMAAPWWISRHRTSIIGHIPNIKAMALEWPVMLRD